MISAASVLVNAALNIMLVRRFGYLGLAVGTSLTALLNASVLLDMLRRRLGGIEGTRLLGVFGRTLVASVVMAAAASALDGWLIQILPGRSLLMEVVRVGTNISGSLVVLLAASWLVGLHEIKDVLRALTARVRRPRRG
jgi:putative peptidoglycan lipid II flippase